MANTPNNSSKGLHYCSFCGRSENAVEFLIPSPTGAAFICDICIEACNQLILENMGEEAHFDKLTLAELPALRRSRHRWINMSLVRTKPRLPFRLLFTIIISGFFPRKRKSPSRASAANRKSRKSLTTRLSCKKAMCS